MRTKITIEVEIYFSLRSREKFTIEEQNEAEILMLNNITEEIKSSIKNSCYFEIHTQNIGSYDTVAEIKVLDKHIMENNWICTDPDNEQYALEVSEKVFRFKEKNRFNGAYEDPNEIIEETINLEDYTEDQMFNHVSAYYDYDEFKEMLDNKEYLIIAECIFEQESGLY